MIVISDEKVEKTYEDYLKEKEEKKLNEVADENLKKEAIEEEWNQLETEEEQDEKTDNDSGDSGSNHHN